METFNDNFDPWSSFVGNATIDGGVGTWASDNPTDNYDTTGWVVDNPVSPPTATLPTPVISDPNFPDQHWGFLEVPIDYNMAMAVPDFLLETEITSPSSSSEVALTPASVDFGSISSPAMSDLGLSPFPLTEQSPVGWGDPMHSPIINTMSEPFASQLTTNPYIGEASIFGAAPVIAAGVSAYQPSSTRTQARQQPMTKDCPPGMPARKWRNLMKPEICPECLKGFNYTGERDKHIAAVHPDVAGKHGVPLKTYVCEHPNCGRKYTRKDRLTRHSTDKHGRVPKKKRHRE